MKQADMRKWHRGIGLIIAVFIIFQAGSGLMLTVSEIGDTPAHSSEGHEHDEPGEEASTWHTVLGWIHHGSSSWMGIYRILLGAALIAQTVIGVMIFFDIRARAKARQAKRH